MKAPTASIIMSATHVKMMATTPLLLFLSFSVTAFSSVFEVDGFFIVVTFFVVKGTVEISLSVVFIGSFVVYG